MSIPTAPHELKHAAFALNVKADTITETDGIGQFTGIASAAGVLDLHGEVIEKGAYDATLKAKGGKFVLLWQHDVTKPIGVIHLSVDARGDLVGRGEINLDVEQGREAYSLLKQGAIGAMSIGFNIPPEGAYWDGEHGILRITRIDLWETSIVTFPANPGATIDSVKAAVAEIVEQAKAGKVLSARNLSLVEDAITALTALRDAAIAEKSAPTPDTSDDAADTDAPAIGHPPTPTEWDHIEHSITLMRNELTERT